MQKTRRSVGADARGGAAPRGADVAQEPGAGAAGPLREPSARRGRLPPTTGGLARPSGQWPAPAGLATAKLKPVFSDGGDAPPCPALLQQAAWQPLA